MTAELAPAVERTRRRPLPAWALVPIAALLWWVVGFLPWLIDGAGRDVLADRGVDFLALPLMSGGVSDLVLGAGLGGVLAGLATRLAEGSRMVRAAAVAAGVTITLLVTAVQSRNAVNGTAVDSRITGGLTIVVVLTTFVGLAIGLVSLIGRVGLGFAIGAAAGATPIWVMSVLNALVLDDSGDGTEVAHRISEWTGAVVLVAALACVGVQPAVRALAWVGVVLLAWLIGPTITAAGYMEVFLRPGMGLPDMWGDQLSATADVWRMAASPDARSLTSWIAAVVVAGAVALWLERRSTAASKQPAQ